MKPWQYLALASGAIIAVVMALASISYNATLGTPEPAFRWLPVSNSVVFSTIALAYDLGMVASVFGFLHWRQTNRMGAVLCAILFVIASLFSVHSVRGYIALNLTKSEAPAVRSADIYTSLKLELHQQQEYLAQLQLKFLKAKRRDRADLKSSVDQLSSKIQNTRSTLAQTDIGYHVSPLQGLEWFLALTLWFFNATCWVAWFGFNNCESMIAGDSVSSWLAQYESSQPEHCAALYQTYEQWCQRRKHLPLPQYSFYARLVELGARKFRDGRNGPTKYELPYTSATRAIAK